GIIYILRPKIKSGLSFSEFEKWISKMSLNIERGRLVDAYNDLSEIFHPMKNAGHVEHLVKGVIEFLGVIKWNHGFDKKYKDFDSRFRGFLAILAEYGEIELARKY